MATKSSPPAQSETQMLAGIQATIRITEAEILMRFVHWPTQEMFDLITGELAEFAEEMRKWGVGFAQDPGCPAGTNHCGSKCVPARWDRWFHQKPHA